MFYRGCPEYKQIKIMDDMCLTYNINLCRFCQVPKNVNLLNTSTTAENGETYLDLLKFIFNDIVWIEDQLISLACKLCSEKILDIAEFKTICLETNRRRFTLNVGDDVKIETPEIKDNINDNKVEKDADEPLSELYKKTTSKKDKDNVSKQRKLKMSENKKSRAKRMKKDDSTNSTNMESSEMNRSVLLEKMCRVCKRTLFNYQQLKRHMQKVHPKHLFYHCDHCEETFPTKDYWERHEFKHNGLKKYVCSYCGAKYITRSDLTHHMETHKEYPKYACTICPDKMFQTSNSLVKHKMLVHTDHKNYKHLCTECGMKFAMISGLRVHLLRHANIRRFSCHLCDKTFCTSQELKSHSVSHSNVKPFKCDLCAAEYKLKSVLLKHKSKVHGIGHYKHAEPKKFNCTYCSKNVSSKCKLLRHIRTHTGVKPFKCRLCETKFTCKSYVKGHVKGKHNIDVDVPDFDAKSYYDISETEGVITQDETCGLILKDEEKQTIIM